MSMSDESREAFWEWMRPRAFNAPTHHAAMAAWDAAWQAAVAWSRAQGGVPDWAMQVVASLAAAISLLERGGRKAAPSDKMFEQMLVDYHKALATARVALAAPEPAGAKGGEDEIDYGAPHFTGHNMLDRAPAVCATCGKALKHDTRYKSGYKPCPACEKKR